MNNENKNICSRCHKTLSVESFIRMNYKQSGESRIFKICNQCNLNKIKSNVNILDNIVNNKFKIKIYNKDNE